MIISGKLYVDDGGFKYEKPVAPIDTAKKAEGLDKDTADAIAFAFYGKTVYEDIAAPGRPVPLVDVNVECGGKKTRVVRQPRYVQGDESGRGRPSPEQFNIHTEDMPKLKTVTGDEFFKLVKDCIDMTFDEFAAWCKG